MYPDSTRSDVFHFRKVYLFYIQVIKLHSMHEPFVYIVVF